VSLAGPRDWSFRARFVGEFRQRIGQKFMPCEAWQYNTSLVPARVYYMRIDFAGLLPMFGVDVYRAGHGRMHGKLLGLITVAYGSRPEFDVSELTTYVNDALMFCAVHAPQAGRHLDSSMTTRSTSACPTLESPRPHGSSLTSRAAWSISAPLIAGQPSLVG
jgi:hypothetical protein